MSFRGASPRHLIRLGTQLTSHGVGISCGRIQGIACRIHGLRHTFATQLAENDVSESTMLALTGHMDRSMLERYSTFDDGEA
jgi:integrase